MESNLKLSHAKPLVFIKVQTTGLNPSVDRIIELSITRVEKDGSSKTGIRLINPGIDITDSVTKINGITNDMVKTKPTFKDISDNINKFLEGCDFVGFNIENFDLRFLSEEFNRAGVEFTLLGRKVVDLSNIYHVMEPRDLPAAYSFYCGKDFTKQNSEGTIKTYFEIINNMMEKYSGRDFIEKDGKSHKIEATVESLNNLFNKNKKRLDIEGNIVLNDAGRPVFTKGKYKDQVISEVLLKDKDYYEWLVDVSTFPSDTKLIVKKILEKAKSTASITQ